MDRRGRGRGIAAAAVMSFAAMLPPAASVLAAPPSNDAFAAPQSISGDSGALTASTVEATTDECRALEDHRLLNSIWYRWRAPSSGFLRLSTVGSDFDTQVHVFLGNAGCPNEPWAGADDTVLPDGTVLQTTDFEIKVRQGVDYVIGVGGIERGSASLGWRFLKPRPMPEDAFEHGRRLYGLNGTIGATNAQATKQAGEPNHAGETGGASLWYVWQAVETGPATFNTSASENDRDTVLAVYTGSSLGTLRLVAADDNGGADTSARVQFRATAGTTYRIALDTKGGLQSAAGGPAQPPWRGLYLSWTSGTPPSHDHPEAALPLPGPYGSLFGETVRASRDAGEPSHWERPLENIDGWGGTSVWYRLDAEWDGEAGATVRRLVNGSTPTIAVYRGTGLADLELVAQNEHTSFDSSSVAWDIAAGQSYLVAVDALDERVGPFSLTWGSGAPNDDFADAVHLDGNAGITRSYHGSMTAEPEEPMHDGYAASHSAWFSWTPSVDDRAAEIGLSEAGMRVGVYTGSTLASLSAVPTGRISDRIWHFAATAGTTYRIAVDRGSGGHTATEMQRVAGPRDTTPPTVRISSPTAGVAISGAFEIVADVNDASGIASVEYLVGTTYAGWMPSSSMVAYAPPYIGSAAGHDGTRAVRARALDRYGNAALSDPVNVLLDTLPAGFSTPEFSQSGPGSLSVRWTPALDVAETVCAVDTGVFTPCTSPLSLTNLTDGFHWFFIRAIDTSGRTQPAASAILVRVGPAPPPPLPTPNPTPSPEPSPTASPTPKPTPSPSPTAAPIPTPTVTPAPRPTSPATDPAAHVVDIVGHKFESDIRWLYSAGITSGCAPDRFCPDGLVTRAQMASFLARALKLPSTSRDYFTDDERSRHEGAINRLRAAGITYGCSTTRFCPDGLVTRAQMAAFLHRALR